jgi:ER membrane protein complex subunit 1
MLYFLTSPSFTVANKNGQIHTIPRRALDPRRPKRKLTSEEQEEGVIPYDPLIPDDPKRVISHRYEVYGFDISKF